MEVILEMEQRSSRHGGNFAFDPARALDSLDGSNSNGNLNAESACSPLFP
jgi:hypothetical protein